MAGFELDMNFTVGALDTGLAALFRQHGREYVRTEGDAGRVCFTLPLTGATARIEVGPMPPERLSPATFPPRSLLTVESDAPAGAVETLRREIVFAFLRVGG